MPRVSQENWQHCGYKSAQLKALINLGAEPQESAEEVIYCVTLTDYEGKELCQWDFPTLGEACSFINKRYGGWEFDDTRTRSDGEGCGSCSAH